MELAFSRQLLVYVIQNTIDELAALLRTVLFGNINVFVDRNFWRNGFKEKEFCDTHFNQFISPDKLQFARSLLDTVLGKNKQLEDYIFPKLKNYPAVMVLST